MSIKMLMRRIWHDIYYTLTFRAGVKFAMRCRDATALVDLGTQHESSGNRFRFRLHLSLCQACANYSNMSLALKKAIKDQISNPNNQLDLQKLNQDLLVKYAENSRPETKN